jgi:hypothetical protein
MPIVAAIIGKPNFGSLTFTIHRSVFYKPRRELACELASSVGRVVVDHQDVGAIRGECPQHRLDVLAFVVRR